MKKPKTAQDVINIIKDFFDEQTELYQEGTDVTKNEGNKLYTLLTALRGPDNDSCRVKEATTSVIRYALFGDILSRMPFGAIVNPDEYRHELIRIEKDKLFNHFVQHAKDAFKVLGLKWSDEEERKNNNAG